MAITTSSSEEQQDSPGAFTKLVQHILAKAQLLDRYIATKNLSAPSFDPSDSQPTWPIQDADVEAARLGLAQAGQDLFELAVGPKELILARATSMKWDIIIAKILSEYNFYDAVPLDGTASIAEIAAETGLNEPLVARIVRFATTMRVFREVIPGHIAHTAQSAWQARNPKSRIRERFFLGTDLDVALALPGAIKRIPNFGGPQTSPEGLLNLAFGNGQDKLTYFEWVSQDEQRRADFHIAMSVSREDEAKGKGISEAPIWGQLPAGSTVVDVGGSTGHHSIALAKAHQHLRFLVQDLPQVVKDAELHFTQSGDSDIPTTVKERISFQTHNFFEPQPVAAPAYMLHLVLHDWSDEDVVRILQNLVRGMQPNSRILIVDILLQWTEKIPLVRSKAQRAMDLDMMVDLGARERSEDDWRVLLAQMNSGLEIESVFTVQDSVYGLGIVTVRLV